jgi:hypothetical protein
MSWRTNLFRALELASNLRHTARAGSTRHIWAVELEQEIHRALQSDGPSFDNSELDYAQKQLQKSFEVK